MEVSEERYKSAQEKKEHTETSDLKRKIFLLHKWNILKIKRNEM